MHYKWVSHLIMDSNTKLCTYSDYNNKINATLLKTNNHNKNKHNYYHPNGNDNNININKNNDDNEKH